jgi:hypothetical protein
MTPRNFRANAILAPPPVTQTCSVEEGGPAWTTAVLGFSLAVVQTCADHVDALG